MIVKDKLEAILVYKSIYPQNNTHSVLVWISDDLGMKSLAKPEKGAVFYKISLSITKEIVSPMCHKKAKKIISACTFELKGGGWCADGYSSKNEKKKK